MSGWNRGHGPPSPPRGPHHPHHHNPGSFYVPKNVEVDQARPVASHSLPAGYVVKVFSRANPEFNLTVKDGAVELAPANMSDDKQLWIRDDSLASHVKDSAGHPAFLLVNKATGKALQHAKAQGQQVRLADYNTSSSGVADVSLMWTLSDDIHNGFKALRMASNTDLNLDAWKGDTANGGIHGGTLVCLYKWNKQANQQWKVVPV